MVVLWVDFFGFVGWFGVLFLRKKKKKEKEKGRTYFLKHWCNHNILVVRNNVKGRRLEHCNMLPFVDMLPAPLQEYDL